jgi:PAS domain S-box-containing protein
MTNRDDIISKNLFTVFPDNPSDQNADGVHNLRASLNSVLRNKTAHTMAVQKYDIRRPDGTFEERFWSPLNKPMLDSNNEVVYIIHRVEDVTDFVRLRNEQSTTEQVKIDLLAKSVEMEIEIVKRSKEIQKLNEGLEQRVAERTSSLEILSRDISDYKFALDASCIVAVTDVKGIIQYVNENFCKISKYGRDELIGKDHRIVNSGYHKKEFIRNLWVTIANGRIWKGEIRNRAKDGVIYWVDTTIVPFLDEHGKPYKYLAIRADITERKLGEEEILKLNEELEYKVTERTHQLTDALEREHSMSEMKSRFVSIASHEFRTPLSAVLSSIALIERYVQMGDTDKLHKHSKRIRSSVSQLTGILDDFLSLGKLDEGRVEVNREDINLNELFEEIQTELTPILKDGQQIVTECPTDTVDFSIDKRILRNITFNLISNASKYSDPGKNIYLSWRLSDDGLELSIQDEGIGIPEEDQKRLFEQFFRASNASNIQGTGLGLNIVKRYVDLLGGRISFESEFGKGTRFTISIPPPGTPGDLL